MDTDTVSEKNLLSERQRRVRRPPHSRVRLLAAAGLGGAFVFGLSPLGLKPADATGVRLIPLQAMEVSDSVLASLRGRYVSPTQIVYFGVEMNTQWRTAGGDQYYAGLYIGINHNRASFSPTVTVLSRAGGNAVNAGSSGNVTPQGGSEGISSAGLDNIQGVVQAVQVTGNTNAARNQLTMTLRSGDAGDAPSGGGWRTGTTYVVNTATGATAGTLVHIRQAGVSISIPGQGIAQQDISSLRGMQQQIQMSGDSNQVLNNVQITAGFTSLRNLGGGIQNAFDSLRNLPQAGMN